MKKSPTIDASSPSTAWAIETGVPIPPARGKGGMSSLTIPVDTLKVGQSLRVPATFRHDAAHTAAYLSGVAGYYVKTRAKNKKFTTRQMGKVVRIWRLK